MGSEFHVIYSEKHLSHSHYLDTIEGSNSGIEPETTTLQTNPNHTTLPALICLSLQ